MKIGDKIRTRFKKIGTITYIDRDLVTFLDSAGSESTCLKSDIVDVIVGELDFRAKMKPKPGPVPRIIKPKEEDIQATIIASLELCHFIVFQTSRRGVIASDGKRYFGRDGVSKGLPDLILRRPTWPKYVLFGLEVKGPETPITMEQRIYSNMGAYPIVRNYDEAIEQIHRFELTL